MFTGIIEGVGAVRAIKKQGDGALIEIGCEFDLERTNIGESIAVNGVCLTVVSRLGKAFWADVSAESLRRTTLGELKTGDPVNLERALTVGARLGGHIVQGHVDCVGTVVNVRRRDDQIEEMIEGGQPRTLRAKTAELKVRIEKSKLHELQQDGDDEQTAAL